MVRAEDGSDGLDLDSDPQGPPLRQQPPTASGQSSSHDSLPHPHPHLHAQVSTETMRRVQSGQISAHHASQRCSSSGSRRSSAASTLSPPLGTLEQTVIARNREITLSEELAALEQSAFKAESRSGYMSSTSLSPSLTRQQHRTHHAANSHEVPKTVRRRRSSNIGIGIVIGMASSPSSSSFASQKTLSGSISVPSSLAERRCSSMSSMASMSSRHRRRSPSHNNQQEHTPSISVRPLQEQAVSKNLAENSSQRRRGTSSLDIRLSLSTLMVQQFCYEVARTCSRLILEVLLPFFWALLGIIGGLWATSETTAKHSIQSASPHDVASLAHLRRDFAEKCKYNIVSSFLLTPTLSISLYGNDGSSASPLKRASASSHGDFTAVTTGLPRGSTIQPSLVHSFVGSGIVAAEKTVTPETVGGLPVLPYVERILRDATIWGILALRFFSPTSVAWFRTSVCLVGICWSVILLSTMSGKSRPHCLHFELTHPRHNAIPSPAFLTYLSHVSRTVRSQDAVKQMIATAQKSDLILNKCLIAIQEVELVSRGFKIGQYPMPPISRIEAAAAAAAAATATLASLPAKGGGATSYAPHLAAATGVKRSMSNTSGTSSESNHKHSSASAGTNEHAISSMSRAPRMRMARLRACLSQAIEEATQSWRILREKLEPLADQEELLALAGMYSPEVPSTQVNDPLLSSDSATATTDRTVLSPVVPAYRYGALGSTPSHRRSDSPANLYPSSPTSKDSSLAMTFFSLNADDSIGPAISGLTGGIGVKRASWNAVSRSVGSFSVHQGGKASLLLAARAGENSKSALETDEGRPQSAPGNPSKRSSLESGLSQPSATPLSRNGSLLRNRKGGTVFRDASPVVLNDQGVISVAAGIGGVACTPSSTGDGGSFSIRSGSRLSYIAERSSRSGPNESPASKRLSYQSSIGDPTPDSLAGSNTGHVVARRESMESIQTGRKTLGSPTAPSCLWQTSPGPLSRNGSLRGSSRRDVFGPLAQPASVPLYGAPDEGTAASDRLSLLGLRHAFESLHTERRRALCLIIALDFEGKESSPASLSYGGYWDFVASSIRALTLDVSRIALDIAKILDADMNDFGGQPAPGPLASASIGAGRRSRSLSEPQSLMAFSGFEDRAHALGAAIRSLQVKLTSCGQELGLSQAPGSACLHGSRAEISADKRESVSSTVRKENAERIWNSIREDIMAITQEWEDGTKILKTQNDGQRGTPDGDGDAASMIFQSAAAASTAATRELESPLEADEDSQTDNPDEYAVENHGKLASRSSVSSAADDCDAVTDSESTESLTRLLLKSTSPDHLPPAGLEQVFESIADIAASFRENDAGRKVSRQERIAKVKKQRQEAQQRLGQGLHAVESSVSDTQRIGAQKPQGVVTELKDVLSRIREKKERLAEEHRLRQPSSEPHLEEFASAAHTDASEDDAKRPLLRTAAGASSRLKSPIETPKANSDVLRGPTSQLLQEVPRRPSSPPSSVHASLTSSNKNRNAAAALAACATNTDHRQGNKPREQRYQPS